MGVSRPNAHGWAAAECGTRNSGVQNTESACRGMLATTMKVFQGGSGQWAVGSGRDSAGKGEGGERAQRSQYLCTVCFPKFEAREKGGGEPKGGGRGE